MRYLLPLTPNGCWSVCLDTILRSHLSPSVVNPCLKYNFISRDKGAFDAKLVHEIADFVS